MIAISLLVIALGLGVAGPTFPAMLVGLAVAPAPFPGAMLFAVPGLLAGGV